MEQSAQFSAEPCILAKSCYYSKRYGTIFFYRFKRELYDIAKITVLKHLLLYKTAIVFCYAATSQVQARIKRIESILLSALHCADVKFVLADIPKHLLYSLWSQNISVII